MHPRFPWDQAQVDSRPSPGSPWGWPAPGTSIRPPIHVRTGIRADADDCPCVLSHEDPAFARANLSLPCVCKGLNDCLPLDEVTGGDFCSHHFQVIRHTFAGCGLVSLNWYLGAGTETHVFEVPSGKLVGVFLSDDLPIVMCNGEDAWSKRGGRFPEDEGCVESSLETICVPDAG